jgi:hypothetical protein
VSGSTSRSALASGSVIAAGRVPSRPGRRLHRGGASPSRQNINSISRDLPFCLKFSVVPEPSCPISSNAPPFFDISFLQTLTVSVFARDELGDFLFAFGLFQAARERFDFSVERFRRT